MDRQTEVALLAADTCLALRKMGWSVERENRVCLIVESRHGPTLSPMELENDLMFLIVTEKIHAYTVNVATPAFAAEVRVT